MSNKEFKRMQQLAGINEIKVNKPKGRFHFNLFKDEDLFYYDGKNNIYYAMYDEDDEYTTFAIALNHPENINMEVGNIYNPQPFIDSVEKLEPYPNFETFATFVNNLKRTSLLADLYIEDEFVWVSIKTSSIKPYINREPVNEIKVNTPSKHPLKLVNKNQTLDNKLGVIVDNKYCSDNVDNKSYESFEWSVNEDSKNIIITIVGKSFASWEDEEEQNYLENEWEEYVDENKGYFLEEIASKTEENHWDPISISYYFKK